MSAKACTDADFIHLFRTIGPREMVRRIGVDKAGIFRRRKNLEKKLGIDLEAPMPSAGGSERIKTPHYPHRQHVNVKDGVVLVGSDGHYWPGPASTAHRAFVKFCKMLAPSAVIMNGDVFDGASISRYPPIGWEGRPTVSQELEACSERLHEIEMAAPKRARLLWPLGNHDSRFESRIATMVPEMAKIKGVHLKDHFGTRWEPCWACWINDGDVVVKHRFKNGIHATHNAVMWAGKTIVTGHLHSLKVTPFSDYRDRPRWGVDCGTLAEPNGPQFVHYSEDNPKNHRSGFVVLTFKDGELLWPEIVHVFDEKRVEWRGELVHV